MSDGSLKALGLLWSTLCKRTVFGAQIQSPLASSSFDGEMCSQGHFCIMLLEGAQPAPSTQSSVNVPLDTRRVFHEEFSSRWCARLCMDAFKGSLPCQILIHPSSQLRKPMGLLFKPLGKARDQLACCPAWQGTLRMKYFGKFVLE